MYGRRKMAKRQSRGRRSGTESARKLLQVLLAFNQRRPQATVKELAEAAGLSLPTAHRYVALLKETGLLEDSGRVGYQLGWRVLQLAQTARASNGLAQVAEPVMRRLVAETDETVTLLQLIGDSMVCVGQIESSRFVRLTLEPGQRLPLSAGASAKVFLASFDRAERVAYLDRMAAEQPGFARRRAALERELEVVRSQGWATSHGEIDEGIWVASAPVSEGGQTMAVLSMACPSYRLGEGRESRIVAMVTEAAREVSETLASSNPNLPVPERVKGASLSIADYPQTFGTV
jgi:DNA-binding IclR family transcriptional regulator